MPVDTKLLHVDDTTWCSPISAGLVWIDKADSASELLKAVKLGAFLISMLICITIGWLWVTSLLPPPLLCSVCILIDHLGWLSGELTLKVIQCNNKPKENGAHVNVLQILFTRFISRLSKCFHPVELLHEICRLSEGQSQVTFIK